MESDLPWVPGAIRALLLADAPYAELIGDRLGTRAPADVTMPYGTIQLPTPLGHLGGGGYKPIVQVDHWCPLDSQEDPEKVVWRMALRAARVLDRARNVAYQTMHYSGRVLDAGPLQPDTKRGDANPLFRAMVRAELTIHNQ